MQRNLGVKYISSRGNSKRGGNSNRGGKKNNNKK